MTRSPASSRRSPATTRLRTREATATTTARVAGTRDAIPTARRTHRATRTRTRTLTPTRTRTPIRARTPIPIRTPIPVPTRARTRRAIPAPIARPTLRATPTRTVRRTLPATRVQTVHRIRRAIRARTLLRIRRATIDGWSICMAAREGRLTAPHAARRGGWICSLWRGRGERAGPGNGDAGSRRHGAGAPLGFGRSRRLLLSIVRARGRPFRSPARGC